jgi:hypothetical protein
MTPAKHTAAPRREASGKEWTRSDKIQLAILIVGAVYSSLTYLLWRSAHETAHNTQRPWVTVRSATFQGFANVGGRPYATVFIKNSGTTPAQNVIGGCYILWQRSPITSDDIDNAVKRCCAPTDRSVAILGPNEENRCENISKTALTKPMVDDLGNGNLRPYVVGVISYNDIFGHTHHTRYCYERDADHPSEPNLWMCGQGNLID